MEAAVADVNKILKTLAIPIADNIKKLRQVAIVSANGDEEIGHVISDVVLKTGIKGAVTVEKSASGRHEWEIVEGLKIPVGYFHFGFINNGAKMRSELKDVAVLVSNFSISNAQQAVQIMEGAKRTGKDLYILTKGIEGEALNVILANKNKGNLNVCVSVLPELEDHGDHMIEDVCVRTGASVMSLRKGTSIFDISLFGHCNYLQSTDESTIIKGGKGAKEDVDKRIEELSNIVEDTQVDYKKDYYAARLAALMGGVGVVKIWANSDVEIRELADRVDDAIHATKAAMEEGIVAGGGVTLKHCKEELKYGHKNLDAKLGEKVGYQLVVECLDMPYKTILQNAGIEVKKSFLPWGRKEAQCYPMGYNVQNNTEVDMIQEGIIDPKKVTRVCIENSVSVAAAFLTIETAIIEDDSIN
jgi:chaperonin GroEL